MEGEVDGGYEFSSLPDSTALDKARSSRSLSGHLTFHLFLCQLAQSPLPFSLLLPGLSPLAITRTSQSILASVTGVTADRHTALDISVRLVSQL